MKKVTLAIAAVIGLSTAADAADISMRGLPAAAPMAVFNWTGFYIGGNAGWARSHASFDSFAVNPQGFAPASVAFVDAMADGTASANNWTGGVQAGYNWQASRWVAGVEADINALSARSALTAAGTTPGGTVITNFTNSIDPRWIATFRGRAGFTFDQSLLYVTGGLAVLGANYNQTFVAVVPPINVAQSTRNTTVGWTVGAGWEQALSYNWSVKAEYLFARFEGVNANTTTPLVAGFTDAVAGKATVDIQQARVGLNYRFGGPVVPRY